MDYEQFLKQVAEDLKYSIPNATIEISDVVKVQGESYRGISVRMNDSPIAASMNLRGAHERLMDGADYHDILQSIHDQAVDAVSQGKGFDLDLVQDYGKAKERLCMEVIPIKGNEELLTGIPHTVMEDLAVIHRIDIDDHAVVTVTNNLLDHFGISEEQLHADALVSAPEIRPAKVLGWDDIGDLSAYNTKSEMRQAMQEKIDPSRSFKNDAHATWQFVNEMKPGDIIFAKKGMHQVIGRGVVGSDYEFDPQRDHYKNIRQVKWTHKGQWQHPGQAVMKTLTDITAYTDYVEKLNSLFESEIEDDIEEPVEIDLKPYDADMFLEEVYMDKTKYDTLVALVEKKKNVILQGAPGVGKTFAAKRLAYSIMGVKDPSRVMMVQFHQSYSYEDFIMGFRPTQEGGFELKHGAFYDFCKSAEVDSEDTPYFFIIDEINRGNLSKIFGELFMLIESDKRGIELKLLYADEKFSVPKNVYIIGMMNTADRSLAMMDYALRRRFAFFDMDPGFNTKGFRQYQEGLQSEKFNKLIERVESLNAEIASDDSLGEGFCIGHSYFCELKETSDQTLSGIVEFELAPLLKEYWFDEPAKAKTWIEDLRSAIK